MLGSAIMAWLHYVSIFAALGLLVTEFVTYRPKMPAARARRLAQIDLAYGVAALAIVGTGFFRALFFEKTWGYYEFQPIFWTKVGVYVLWAVLSLPPTFHFFALRKRPEVRGHIEVESFEYHRVRAFMIAQLAIAPVPPLLAALLARGVGASGSLG